MVHESNIYLSNTSERKTSFVTYSHTIIARKHCYSRCIRYLHWNFVEFRFYFTGNWYFLIYFYSAKKKQHPHPFEQHIQNAAQNKKKSDSHGQFKDVEMLQE